MNTARVNLLPSESLRAYVRHRRFTIIARLIAAFGIVFLMLDVFVGSAWLYLSILEKAEKQLFVVARESKEASRAEELEGKLGGLSAEVDVLRDLDKPQYDPAILVSDIASVMPLGIHLQTLSMAFVELDASGAGLNGADVKDGQEIFLSGQAETRNDILAFERALAAFPFVAAIEAPLENIIKPAKSPFSFVITLKQLTANPSEQESETETPVAEETSSQ